MPKTYNEFERYVLEFSSEHGLCSTIALGRDISTDSFGIAVKGRFSELEEGLSSLYGRPDKSDFLLPGSICGRTRRDTAYHPTGYDTGDNNAAD